MKMNESVEIAQRLDAIYDTELTNRLVSSLSSPSYTLAELETFGTGILMDHSNTA